MIIPNDMERITDISQLKIGDKIFSINYNCELIILEFLCLHPHNHYSSLFMDIKQDGMPQFYNNKLKNEQWYRYDDSLMEKDIPDMKIKALTNRIEEIKWKVGLWDECYKKSMKWQ